MAKKVARQSARPAEPARKPAGKPARAAKPSRKPARSAAARKPRPGAKPAAKPKGIRGGEDLTVAKAAALASAATKPAKAKPDAPAARKLRPVAERPDHARGFAIEAARSAADDKCDEVVVLDVRGIYQECDYVVIASGTSDRQIRSAGDAIGKLGPAHGYPLLRQEVDDRSTWMLLDFVDVTVHLFEPNTRAYYDLEMRWGDAKKVAWAREGDRGTARAPR